MTSPALPAGAGRAAAGSRHWCAPRVRARWRRWAGMGCACCRCHGRSGSPSRRLWAVQALGCAAGCQCSPVSALPAPTWAASTSGRVSCPGTTLPSSRGASLASWWCPVSRPSACYSGENSQASRHIPAHPDGLQAGGHFPSSTAAPAADHAPRSWARCLTDMRWLRNQVIAPLTEELVFRACMLPMLAPCTGLGPAVFTCPLFFGVAHFHHIFEQLRFRQSSVGSIFLSAVLGQEEHAGVVTRGLPVSSVPVLLHSCLRCLHCFPLHPHRTPDWAGPLPLLLQLHGLSCRVCSPGASAEAAPAGRLCSGCGTLPASAPAPHGPQALRQPSPLCAFGASRGLRGSPVLLTHAPMNSHGLPSPSPSRGTAGEELAGVPEISGIFVGD
ncbi:CAAX prenyl protease 2 isoform X1 [Ursus maritimus]|uniref:CAAX prenyl protease 2 n=1 Tax=Ursus maritimus TaxID=29073 RepID=A0A8M1GVA7_URSMA|nr:CAAX prenyl protease 2 isoform X1 [Ursus maritimus]